jgi:integrase
VPERLRTVLSQEEVARLIEAAPGVKYKAAFAVTYGAGLRVSEVVYLKVSDIDSNRFQPTERALPSPTRIYAEPGINPFMPPAELCRTDLERYVAIARLQRIVEHRPKFHSV